MKAIMSNAEYTTYNATTQIGGNVRVNLSTSTNTGYPNNCSQYNPYGFISVPLPVQTVNTEVQALSEVIVTGYENTITDTNFTVSQGESAIYGTNWYFVNSVNGIYMQPVNTTIKEYAMAGNTTNTILSDMINLLVAIITYLGTIETIFNNHVHTSAAPSNPTTAPLTQFTDPPNDEKVNTDGTKITNSENLIGNSYKQYLST